VNSAGVIRKKARRIVDAKAAEMLMDAGISLIDPAPALAKRIVNLKHFKAFLLATPLLKRKPAYDALRPHLAFKVPEFKYLFAGAPKRRKVRIPKTQ